jgi:hypothetical protein
MNIRRCLTYAFLLTAISNSVFAASIRNGDKVEYTVTIIEGEKQTQHQLVPGAVLDNVCPKLCKVKLSASDEGVEVDSTDNAWIQEGKIVKSEP